MWVLNKLHGTDPPRCPRCGEPVADNLLRTFWESRRLCCGKCRKMFTALTGTFLSGCHMTFREIFLLAVLLSFDLADRHIAQIMKMSPENVRLWRLKLNQR
jgi:transposase-like protein